jgi:hypothetical protein
MMEEERPAWPALALRGTCVAAILTGRMREPGFRTSNKLSLLALGNSIDHLGVCAWVASLR